MKSEATEESPAAARFVTFLWCGVGLVGLGYVALFLFTSLSRIGYPYELEWLEGSQVDHIGRILDGFPLYAKPSIDFTANLYAPLYFYLCAAVCKVVGLGFTPPRVISLIATLGCFSIIFAMVRRETGQILAGLIAAGLYAATFAMCGAFLDNVRVDSLFLFFLVGAAYLVRFEVSRTCLLVAAALSTLSFLTKQSAVLPLSALVLWSLLQSRKHLLWFVLPTVLALVAALLLLDHLFHGWMLYYTVAIPASQKIRPDFVLGFWTEYIAKFMAIAFLLTLLWLVLSWRTNWRRASFWFLFTGASLVMACVGWAKVGGYLNHVSIAAIGLSMSGIVSAFKLHARAGKLSEPGAWRLILAMALLFQFGVLRYNPRQIIPTDADRKAGDQFIGLLRAAPGAVFVPLHGYYARMAGKSPHAHLVALDDVRRFDEATGLSLAKGIDSEISTQHYGMIAYDISPKGTVLSRYQQVPSPFADTLVFRPVGGAATQPSFIYYPR